MAFKHNNRFFIMLSNLNLVLIISPLNIQKHRMTSLLNNLKDEKNKQINQLDLINNLNLIIQKEKPLSYLMHNHHHPWLMQSNNNKMQSLKISMNPNHKGQVSSQITNKIKSQYKLHLPFRAPQLHLKNNQTNNNYLSLQYCKNQFSNNLQLNNQLFKKKLINILNHNHPIILHNS